jgi:hypothetical protein
LGERIPLRCHVDRAVVSFFVERTIPTGLPFELFVSVYLLLPSTGARFARAAGRASA